MHGIKCPLRFGLDSAGSGSATGEVALDLHCRVERSLQRLEGHLRCLGLDGLPFLATKIYRLHVVTVTPGTPIPSLFTPMPSINRLNDR